jgi:hypothetical protein
MSATYYTITDERIAEIVAADPTLTAEQVREIATADWNEGDKHQEWINTAPASEVADWVATLVAQA